MYSHGLMKACEDMAHCFYQHKNRLQDDVVPVRQQRYRMNPNYATHVKEQIDKLVKIGFIRLVKQATWLSPIVVVPKKN